MTTKEKWFCARYCGGNYKVKQVFVTESEHYFTVKSMQDEECVSMLGFKKKIRKSDQILFDRAYDAVQHKIDLSERAIHDHQRKVTNLISDLRELDVLKVGR